MARQAEDWIGWDNQEDHKAKHVWADEACERLWRIGESNLHHMSWMFKYGLMMMKNIFVYVCLHICVCVSVLVFVCFVCVCGVHVCVHAKYIYNQIENITLS